MGRIELTKDAVSCVIVAFAGTLIAVGPLRADSPKPESVQAQAQQRAYLPVLLQRTLLENEREYVRSLADFFKLFEILREGGQVSDVHVAQVEQALLQGRVRVVQRDTNYRDALDQFKLRFDLSPKRLQKMEESALLPLTHHLQRFEAIFTEHDMVRTEPNKNADPEKASKLRALLRQSLTSSALVKDTRFGEQFDAQWGEWEKLKDLEEPLRKCATERRKLLERKTEFELQAKPFPQADVLRLEEVSFQIDLGQLERVLRAYESQPWKAAKDENLRQLQHQELFGQLRGAFDRVLQKAVSDRIVQSRQTWPALAPVRLKEVDILTCDLEKSEQVVASFFKKPEEAVAGKVRMRKVRALAETYRIQQRLSELSRSQIQTTLDILKSPPDPGLVARADDTAVLAQRLLGAQRSFAEVNGHLRSNWINYQIARFDLYRDLGLPPP